MAVARSNDNPFGPKDKNDMGSFQEQAGDGKKSTWPQFYGLFGGSIDDGGNFQKHAECMIRFRKSHVPYQNVGSICQLLEPILHIDATANEAGGSRDHLKVKDWFRLPENGASRHKFSPN
jgi:hypothetical protein